MNVMLFSTGDGTCTTSKRFRKPEPNCCRLLNGRSADTAAALPGITRSVSPNITEMNLSVVGSGPTRMPW